MSKACENSIIQGKAGADAANSIHNLIGNIRGGIENFKVRITRKEICKKVQNVQLYVIETYFVQKGCDYQLVCKIMFEQR